MPKCSKCSTRKAKRECPGLSQEICPQCCATHRLSAIPCPRECPYLQGEYYQHRRRKERAASQGKEFIETNQELFKDRETLDFAFKIQADIYYFLRRHAVLDDRTIAEAIEFVRRLLSPIFVPTTSPHALTLFLRKRLDDRGRYPAESGPQGEDRLRALRDLSRHVASLGGEGTHRYADILGSFFDALDFEADLDYSPLDQEEGAEPQEPTKSPGGLILP